MGNSLKTVVLLAALSALLILIGDSVAGQQGMIIAFAFAVVMNFGSYWFSDKLVLKMYRASECPADHRVSRAVAKLARTAGLPMPKVYIVPSQAPNAFATGRNADHAAVAVTQGLLSILNDSELEGVLAHELAHVRHRDILIQSVAATLGAAIMMLANMARWGAILGGRRDERGGSNAIGMLATALLAPFAAMLIQSAISRSREFLADAGGAEIAGSPRGLASALRKLEQGAANRPMDANPATAHLFIVNPFAGQAITNLFRTHPTTEERIHRLLGTGTV